jgi:phosphoglycolate phosphatase-like HAD superfamily hydrolase
MATSSDRPVIVFDLDGTLVDVAARDYAVYRDVLVEDGWTPLPCSEYWPLRRERTPLPDVLACTVPDATAYLAGFVVRRAARYESPRYLDLDTVLPEVATTLAGLAERYACVLITARRDAGSTRSQLDALDLARYFQAVHVADGNKAVPLRTLHRVALVVGDTEHDICLARDHGYPSFAVSTGMRSRQFLAAGRPTYLADGLGDLAAVLQHQLS